MGEGSVPGRPHRVLLHYKVTWKYTADVSLTHSEATALWVRMLYYGAKWNHGSHPIKVQEHLNGWLYAWLITEIWDQFWKLVNPEILFTTRHRCLHSLSDFIVSWKMYATTSPDNHLQVWSFTPRVCSSLVSAVDLGTGWGTKVLGQPCCEK